MLDILAVAAHPDDVELSCAGTLLMAKRQGKRVGIVDLTRGELSTRGTPATRAQETEDSSRILELDVRANLGMPDGNIEISKANERAVIEVLREHRPTVVLCPHKAERHPDHEAASELVHRAVFYSGLAKIETTNDGAAQAPHRPLLVLQYMQTYTFQPTLITDVSPVFEQRMQAVEAYQSQFARPKNVSSRVGTEFELNEDRGPETFLTQTNFFDWIRARASAYGMIIGAEYGEPFWSHEPLGTADLFSLVTKRVS
jgi:bacillithiol biosynthesis deacetylase BshB1